MATAPESALGTHTAPDSHRSVYAHGFARVAAISPPVALGDPARNAEHHLQALQEAHENQVTLAVFPELSLTGSTLGDLIATPPLIDATQAALAQLIDASQNLLPVIVVGAPLPYQDRLLNAAVVIHRGSVLGIHAKRSLSPEHSRWFTTPHPERSLAGPFTVRIEGAEHLLASEAIHTAVDLPGLRIAVQFADDAAVPLPPAHHAALGGATVIAQPSAAPATVGHSTGQRSLTCAASAHLHAAIVHATPGRGESTTDHSFAGETAIYEDGELLAAGARFTAGASAVADIDLDRLCSHRARDPQLDQLREPAIPTRDGFLDPDLPFALFEHVPAGSESVITAVSANAPDAPATEHEKTALPATGPLRRPLHRFPFVPTSGNDLDAYCADVFAIQVAGLIQRLRAIGGGEPGGTAPLIGVSGGLDSTHALLVIAQAMDELGRDRSEILTFTMPGFGTSENTRSNAQLLAESLGCSFTTIDIRSAAQQMLTDIGHPAADGEPVYDVTYENVQAGLRTDYLFRLANHHGGIVVGTGDLSELALGWCTYGVGDHMSHYGVNGGIPKTLMQHLIRWVISSGTFGDETGNVLQAVLDTEITPELIPHQEGKEAQSTENSIGPYALHDFALYHVLRFGFSPAKIAYLAHQTWHDPHAGQWPAGYPEADQRGYSFIEIRDWLEVFIRRFLSQQFKRSALPDGPGVHVAGSLSPRGAWKAPSDVSSATWIAALQAQLPTTHE